MGPEFFQTGMGRKFYEADVPRIAKGIERLAAAIEKQNELTERRIQMDEQFYASAQPSPDSLRTLTGPFMASAGGEEGPFHDPLIAFQDRQPKAQLHRWHGQFRPKGVSTEDLDSLYHTLMNKLPGMAANVDEGQSPEELADAVVLPWVQDSTSMETDGRAYRELVNLVAGLVMEETGETT